MRRRLGGVLLHVFLIGAALVAMAPLLWLLCAAFKHQNDIFDYFLLPPLERLTLGNFSRLLADDAGFSFTRVLLNSVIVSAATLAIQLVLGALGGFALAKHRFRGRTLVAALMLLTMMVPPQVLLAPLWELVAHMSLTDTLLGLILPTCVSVLGVFLFRQTMLQIPDDMLAAARIDGCGEWRLFWHVALPTARPMIGAFSMISFMITWNAYLWPLIMLTSPQKYTLPIALARTVTQRQQDYGVLMAGTLLAVLPPIVLFLFLQRQFVRGLTEGAVKG